jgi:hypothetical protein
VTFPLPRILFFLATGLAMADAAWISLGGFAVDTAGYARIGLLSAALFLGGLCYSRWRPDPRLATMLLGTAFLIAFTAGASILNYLLLPVAGPRMDFQLARIDRAMGFDWPTVMTALSHHRVIDTVLWAAYSITLPQIAVLLVALSLSGRCREAYRFLFAVAAGALIAIFVWALAPSAGAASVYSLAPDVSGRLLLVVTCDYGRALVDLLNNGPGLISPSEVRGLIGFPSYHAMLALILIWYARTIAWLRWPALIVNLLVVASAPVEGGHHLVDVIAAFPMTALAILSAQGAERLRLPVPMTTGPTRPLTQPARETILP